MLEPMHSPIPHTKRPTPIRPIDDAKNFLEEFIHTVARRSRELGESRATSNGMANVHEGDIVIAVMGPTGSGKSTFICSASGQDTCGVGQGLTSFTDKVATVKFRDEASGRDVVLVDTPGFDDTFKSDFHVLTMISEWLSSSYRQGKLLSGILYLHRITDNRVAGTSLKNLQLFKKLCGDDALDKVHLTTTMWDEVDESVGEGRLKELKTVYWKSMIEHGAQMARCRSDNDSAKNLLRRIILADTSKGNDATRVGIPKHWLSLETCRLHLPHTKQQFQRGDVSEETRASMAAHAEEIRKVLQIQEEMVDRKMELRETAAGQQLYSQLDVLAEQQAVVLRRLENEIKKKAAMDEDIFAELRRERDALQAQMHDWMRQMEELRLPWFKRFLHRK